MNEELIEKCRLTDEEIGVIDYSGVYDYFQECEKRDCIAGNSREAGFDCEGRYLNSCEYHKRTVTEEKVEVAKAQLAKAIPLISAEARKQFIEEIKPLLNASVGDMMDGLTRIYRNLTATYLPAKKGCTFKGACGNRLADGYCSAFSCSWQALFEGGKEAE